MIWLSPCVKNKTNKQQNLCNVFCMDWRVKFPQISDQNSGDIRGNVQMQSCQRIESGFFTDIVQKVLCERCCDRKTPPQVTAGVFPFKQWPGKMPFLRWIVTADCTQRTVAQDSEEELLEDPSQTKRRKSVQIHISCGNSLLYEGLRQHRCQEATKKHRAGNLASLVECLFSMPEALGLMPSTA